MRKDSKKIQIRRKCLIICTEGAPRLQSMIHWMLRNFRITNKRRLSAEISWIFFLEDEHWATPVISKVINSKSSLHFYHLEFILLYILHALVHCVALCSTGQHAEGGGDSIVGGHWGEKDVAPGAIGDICRFSYQYWHQTFPVFQFCCNFTKLRRCYNALRTEQD